MSCSRETSAALPSQSAPGQNKEILAAGSVDRVAVKELGESKNPNTEVVGLRYHTNSVFGG